MKFYMAPLEGITGYIFRNAYEQVYGGVDKYFTPFLVPTKKKKFKTKEKNDILPEHNKDMYTVPQILTNNADGFIQTANNLKEYGYKEVNLNLGCPSGTVVSKYKGAGFLAKPDELEAFLERIFNECEMDISVKTRIGMWKADEFCEILDIFNRYPLKELIIHPRVREDYYKGKPNLDMFEYGFSNANMHVCYNGDIKNRESYEKLLERIEGIDNIMIGRGIIENPALILELNGMELSLNEKMNRLKQFHDFVFEGYVETLSGSVNAMYKMKELWYYMISNFPENEKAYKKIRKCSDISEYRGIVDGIFLR